MPANNLYIDKVKERSDRIIIPEKEFLNEKQLEQLNEALQKFPEIICEIGSGSGSHLVEFAKRNPQHLAIGVELRFKRLYKTLEKAEQLNLANILLMLVNAHKIEKYLPKNSLSGVYINFPDPWSKRRWLKHRIMQQSWIDSICTLLKPGAYISYKTDHTVKSA
jgi:tRNA (guanine-N7-)-methyltransferase